MKSDTQQLVEWVVENDEPEHLSDDPLPPDMRAEWDARCGFVVWVAALRLEMSRERVEAAVVEGVRLGLLRQDGYIETPTCEGGPIAKQVLFRHTEAALKLVRGAKR